jgi:hypothetical protein
MWRAAGCYDAPYMSHGKKVSEVFPAIYAAIADMQKRPDVYRAMNPENGWGGYESALGFLMEVAADFITDPDAIIGVSK